MYCIMALSRVRIIHPLFPRPTHSNANVSIALLVARAPHFIHNRHTRTIPYTYIFRNAITCRFRFRGLASRLAPFFRDVVMNPSIIPGRTRVPGSNLTLVILLKLIKIRNMTYRSTARKTKNIDIDHATNTRSCFTECSRVRS